MKLLKLAFISALVFALLLTGISMLIPSQVRISRAIDIAAPIDSIKPYLQDVGAWEQWNFYIDSLSDKKRESAESLVAKDMSIRIYAQSDSSVMAGWTQPGGQKFTSHYRLIRQTDQLTTVQWYFDFTLDWYPWEKFSSIIYDQQFGPTMEKSLQQLRAITE
jgi:hypothetical protein